MKKVIIGIHGLGNKPPAILLRKWWKDAMMEGLKRNGIKKKLPRFELVYWADILHDRPLDYSEKDRESPYFLDEPYTRAPGTYENEDHSFRKKVIDFVSEELNRIFLNEDMTLNYGFITDIILKKYFSDLEVYYKDGFSGESGPASMARHHIRQRLRDAIARYKGYDIMIVAHSMGSIIAFDVLSFMPADNRISTLVTIGSPLGLPVVVSRIAAEHKNDNPGKIMVTPPCIASRWINMADIMDKIAIHYKISDDFGKNSLGIQPEDILVRNDYIINGIRNPHKSFGYLRTPEFTGILGDFIGEARLNVIGKIIRKVLGIFENVKEQSGMIKDQVNIQKN
jgi:hypothetical protein